MRKYLLLSILSVFLFSCEEDETSTPTNALLNIEFKHYYESEPLQIKADNTLNYTNSSQNNWNVKSLKYYISKIIIYKADQTSYDVNMYKFINLSEPGAEVSNYVLKDIPDGRYVKMSFVFGIDSARNVSFGLDNTVENNSMEWPSTLGGGYHIMMMDGVYRTNQNQLSGYGIHLGKPGNQVKLEYPIDYTAQKGSSATISIQMNIDQWMNGLNKIDLNDGYGYIMDNDAKQLLFKQNAASSVFSIVQK